ncbi:MAG: adenylate/guanylate cyclase domain-containing protein [Candidatus Riflebacteria bacterium]
MPLIFVNYLSQTILERSRQTSTELLKEKIMQEVESFKLRLSPESYVKHLIQKTHRKILPEMTQDLLKMIPEKDFGEDIYTSSIPEKFVGMLKDHELSPLLFISCGPGFTTMNYWFAPELNEQVGKDARKLSLSLTVNLMEISSIIYYMNYQKRWSALLNPSFLLAEIIKSHSTFDAYFNRYISRFTDLMPDYDKVYRIYTDYFSRQYLYSYSICSMSQENIHGGYTVLVRGDSIAPEKIAEYASAQIEHEDVECLVEAPQGASESGFFESPEGLFFTGSLPTRFSSHITFWKNNFPEKAGIENYFRIKVSGSFPKDFQNQRFTFKVIRAASAGIGFLLVLSAFYTSLFGFSLPVQVRKKLLLVVGAIFLLPVTATGVVSYYLLSGFDRIVELHLKAQLENRLNRILYLEDEKRSGMQSRIFEIKQLLEKSNLPTKNILNNFSLPKEFPGIWNWLSSISFMEPNGDFNSFNQDFSYEPKNIKLTEGLLGKYSINQGFLKASGPRARELDLKINLTLGLLEGFLTPEIEEAASTKEGTLQREITHTVDTYVGCLLICMRNNGENVAVYARSSNNEEMTCDYLISLNMDNPKAFRENSAYSDIKSGIRIRRMISFTNYGWPGDVIFDNELAGYFHKATAQRSSGAKIIRDSDGMTITAWKFREFHSVVMVALGKARRENELSLAISMIFPVTIGYSLILLVVVTGVLSQLLIKPIDILKHSIEKINNNCFGITIANVEIAEFRKVTNAFNEMSIALKQKELIGRYVSDRLLESIEKGEDQDDETKVLEVTVLASDIRSFTTIAETYPPLEVVDMLNSYFTAMEEAIVGERGLIDKFIGDAIQAVFYHHQELDPPGLRAARAATKMRQKLEEFNQERKRMGLFTIDNGIGIATGEVISGTIGSKTGRKTFTVTGPPVSAAASLEAYSAKTQSKIVICPRTFEMFGESHFSATITENGAFELKGERFANR